MAERAHPEDQGFQEGSPYRANLFKRYAFASRFTAGKVVLDVPCGVGWGTSLLTAQRRLGLDVAPEAIAYARARYPGIDFLVGNMAKIPLAEGSVDVVVCLEGLEHVDKVTGRRFLDEAVRVVRPEGLLVMTVPVIPPGGKHSGNPYHLYEPSLSELKDLLAPRFEAVLMDTVAGPDGPVVYFVGRVKAGAGATPRVAAGCGAAPAGRGRANFLLTTSAAPTQAPFSTKEKRPPLGLGFLISVLRAAGHQVFFLDNYLQPSDFLETDYLQEHAIHFVGIYANTICFRDTLRMLKKLQELRRTHQWSGKIIVGGPHASVAPQTIPNWVDYVVQGEGEHAILDIVAGKVTERVVRYPRIENLDELPPPAWDCFVDLPYTWDTCFLDDTPVFTMNTSRGCPFQCTFCSVGSVWGKRYTYFSAERIASDVEHLVQNYGAKGIYFREDNFTLNEARLRRFCHLLIEKGIRVPWVCESRVSTLTRELVELMARAGARGFYFGVESGSQRMLDLLGKGITVEQTENAFRWCREFGIKTAASVVVGVPGETASDLAATQDLLQRIQPTITWPNVFVGIPDSRLYRSVLESRAYEYIDDRGLVYLPGHNEKVRHYYGGSWNAGIPDTEEAKDGTSRPKVSVLMAVHNGERFAPEALASIHQQTYQDFEVVIVDDGSSDRTPEILRQAQDTRTVIYRNAENCGLTKSLNTGLRLCRGEYIARMDADDVAHPRRLEKQVQFLEQNPECCAVGSWCNWIDAEGRVTGSWEPPTEAEAIRSRLLVRNCLAHGAAMIRRSILEQAGGYDEAYPCAQDYDLWLRLSEVGQVRNLGEYLHSGRLWEGALSRSKGELQRQCANAALLAACRRRHEPYVTIVTVNHNTPDFIRLCIAKVFEFSDLPFEMLVTDNGSTDESLAYLQSEKRIRLVSLPGNIGHGPALDHAMQYVRSRYVVVMDSDAHPLRRGWLQALLEPLNEEVLLSGVYHHRAYVHPACLAMETQTFREGGLSFQPNWPRDGDLTKLGVTHWDVGELLSMEVRRRGKQLHYFPLSNQPASGIAGSEYGGIVYHHFFGTRVVQEPQRAAFGPITRETILEAKRRHFAQGSAAPSPREAPATGNLPEARTAVKLSVVLTTYNRPQLLEQVLAGFARQTAARDDFEVVVVDDGSTPPVREVTEKFSRAFHLKYLQQSNAGLAAARNAGIRLAEGRLVLFSDDDDVPAPELVAEHLRSHGAHPDETIAVLGHLEWHPDLEVSPLMHYVTRVGGEYFGFDQLQDGQFYDQWKWWGGLVSAKRSLLQSLDGPFEPRLRFGYEDTELACRLLPRQIRILYNARARSFVRRPITFDEFCRRSYKQGKALHRVAALHPEIILRRYGLEEAGAEYRARYAASLVPWTDKIAKFEALLAAERGAPGGVTDRHLQALYGGYRECFRGYVLKGYVEQLEAAERGELSARDPVNVEEAVPPACDGGAQPAARPLRIAFVDTNTPCFDVGSSSQRVHQIVKFLVAQGHHVDYLYTNRFESDKKYKAAYDGAVRFTQIAPSVNSFRDYLHFHRDGDLDAVWITNLWAVDYVTFALHLVQWLKENQPQTKVIIDTMDLHHKKFMRRFEISQDPQDRETAERFLSLERTLYPLGDRVLAVTDVEKGDILAQVGACRVEVIPNLHEALPHSPDLHQRRQICFLGGARIAHNFDALQWFLREVQPLIVREVPDVQFHILGHGNEEFREVFETHPNVKVVGYVEDAERAVAQYRLFVCPMLYGAGMKGKLGVAAAAGTPFVTTTIGAEGFGFVEGQHCLIADRPEEFARQCVRVLREDALAERLRTEARELLEKRFSLKAVGPRITRLLQSVTAERQPERLARPESVAVLSEFSAPKVSIVTTCRNCEKYLPECLDSIRGQTLREWELLLLDDGSTDGTRRIIEEYRRRDARIQPFCFEHSEGPAARRNFAIERARSEFVVIHDADDIMSPYKLKTLYNEIRTDPKLAVVGSYYRAFLYEFQGLPYTDCQELPLEHEEIVAGLAAWEHVLAHASAIIRKEMFLTLGAYDGNPFASDAFWLAKLAEYARRQGEVRLKNVPEYLTLRRVHPGNQTIVFPPIDPRNRRARYRQYCQCKLRQLREKTRALSAAELAAELRNCDCSDFLVRFKAQLLRWESEPLDKNILPALLHYCAALFQGTFYVTCVSVLASIESMERDIARRCEHYDLLQALALFALDLKEQSRSYLEREIRHHDSPAAREFLIDCLEADSPRDVQNWCAARPQSCVLQLADARENALVGQAGRTNNHG